MRYVIVDGFKVDVRNCSYCPCFEMHPDYLYEGECHHPGQKFMEDADPDGHAEYGDDRVPDWCPLREVGE